MCLVWEVLVCYCIIIIIVVFHIVSQILLCAQTHGLLHVLVNVPYDKYNRQNRLEKQVYSTQAKRAR